jgi:uncharacterized phage protein (TIGR01671 family)
MREIKFRGKRVDNGEWVYGSLVQCDITGKRYILPMGSDANESDKVRHEGCLMLFTFEVIPETVGQYTGLEDKNSKEIYEGDIIRVTNEVDEVNELDSDTGIGVVEWLDRWGFWNISNIENGLGDILNCRYVEIIGNIHENKYILKEGEDER